MARAPPPSRIHQKRRQQQRDMLGEGRAGAGCPGLHSSRRRRFCCCCCCCSHQRLLPRRRPHGMVSEHAKGGKGKGDGSGTQRPAGVAEEPAGGWGGKDFFASVPPSGGLKGQDPVTRQPALRWQPRYHGLCYIRTWARAEKRCLRRAVPGWHLRPPHLASSAPPGCEIAARLSPLTFLSLRAIGGGWGLNHSLVPELIGNKRLKCF